MNATFLVTCLLLLGGASWAVAETAPRTPEPDEASVRQALTALRTLDYERSARQLKAAGDAGNARARCLLAMMYLNGVGVTADPKRARLILQQAAESGDGVAAYVLAGELAGDRPRDDQQVRTWLQRASALGYSRATELLASEQPPFDRQAVLATDGSADQTLLRTWIINRARHDDAQSIRRLGPAAVRALDDFGRSALANAVAVNAVDAAEALIALGADVNAVDEKGVTPLMLAAQLPQSRLTEQLLADGADPAVVDTEGRSALFYAALADQPASIDALHRAGASPDATDSEGLNALDRANSVGANDAAHALEGIGSHNGIKVARPDQVQGRFDLQRPGELYRGWSAIALAAARDDAAEVARLLSSDGSRMASPQMAPAGDSLLEIAANERAFDALSVLLTHGISPATPDHDGHTVLWSAVAGDDLATVKALLSAGLPADAHAGAETTPLLAASLFGQTAIARALLDAGSNVNSLDAHRRSALMLAAAVGDVELVRLLLARHTDLNTTDEHHRSALWYSVNAGSPEIADLLLEAGADCRATDADGWSPVHLAATRGDNAVLSRLLQAGEQINQLNAAGDTPLLLAAASGHQSTVTLLLSRSASLDAQNRTGDTALMAAARNGHTEICNALLRAGANKALRNQVRASAADIASGRGFAALAQTLRVST